MSDADLGVGPLGSVYADCQPVYPKPGQVGLREWTVAQVPAGSINPLDYAAATVDNLAHLPDAFVNGLLSFWNLVVDALMPSECLGRVIEDAVTELQGHVPFNWVASAQAAIESGFGGAEGSAGPASVTMFGHSFSTGGWFGASSPISSVAGTFRPLLVGALYLQFALWLWGEALAWAGRRNTPKQLELWEK